MRPVAAALVVAVLVAGAEAARLRRREATLQAAESPGAGYTLPSVGQRKAAATPYPDLHSHFIAASEGSGAGSGGGYAGALLPTNLHVTRAGNVFMMPAADPNDDSQVPLPQPLQGDMAVPDAPALGIMPVLGQPA